MTINSRTLLSPFLALTMLAVANTADQGVSAQALKGQTPRTAEPGLTLISSYRSWKRMNLALIVVPFDTANLYA